MTNTTVLATVYLSEISPSALACHQEANEWFSHGGTISKAASQYAVAADTFFARSLVWLASIGALSAPANDNGKCPKCDRMSEVSSDSKNSARQYAQQVFAAAWALKARGLDPFEFASLRAMRAALSAKDKVLDNPLVIDGIAGEAVEAGEAGEAGEAVEAGEAGEEEKFHRVSVDDFAMLMHDKDLLSQLIEELSKAKPSIAKMQAMLKVS